MSDRDASTAPFFSVIMPTRNRPELFLRALDSVLQQSLRDIEVLVVNDGSAAEFLPRYQAMEADSDPRVRWFHQPLRPNGHGPSYSINTGAYTARGQYLCILDDDDSWEAQDHLMRVRDVINSADTDVDAYYSNQIAFRADGTQVQQALWLSSLTGRLTSLEAGTHDTYRVEPAFLLQCSGFPHLNCTIIRRALYLEINGMDEGIRYECEVDLYLRTLDAATHIVYDPEFVARHNVPDKVAKTSVSTAFNDLQKCLSQIVVYQKNLTTASAEPIRATCVRNLSMLYKKIAAHFVKEKQWSIAARYARMALACRWSFKWWLYCLYLRLVSTLR